MEEDQAIMILNSIVSGEVECNEEEYDGESEDTEVEIYEHEEDEDEVDVGDLDEDEGDAGEEYDDGGDAGDRDEDEGDAGEEYVDEGDAGDIDEDEGDAGEEYDDGGDAGDRDEDEGDADEEYDDEGDAGDRDEDEGDAGDIGEDEEDADEEDKGGEEDEVDKDKAISKKVAKKQVNRQARQCAMCGNLVKYLSHHLTRQHNVTSKTRRTDILNQSRKLQPIKKSDNPKNKRKRRDCPIKGCTASSLARIENHFLSVHKLKRGSPEYIRYLTECKFEASSPPPETISKVSSDDKKGSVFDRVADQMMLMSGHTTSAKKSADQHTSQMKKMCEMAGGMKDLFCDSTKLRDIVRLLQQSMAPKTTMKYLDSLKKLAAYLLIEDEEALEMKIPHAKVMKTEKLASQFIKGLRPMAKKRETKLKSEIREKMIDVNELTKFRSMLREEAMPVITRMQNKEKLSWLEVVLVRNYLIIEVFIAGAPRSGVISSMSLGEVKAAVENKQRNGNTYWIVTVGDHKTASSHGPAKVVFCDAVFRWVKIYEEFGRPFTPNIDGKTIFEVDSPFFLGSAGSRMSRLAQTICRMWEKKGFTSKINPTFFRYTAATKACENLQKITKRKVADLMAHQESTQEHYYKALQRDDDAVEASVMISQLFCQPTQEEETQEDDNLPTTSNYSASLFSTDTDVIPPSQHANQTDHDLEEDVEGEQGEPSTTRVQNVKRKRMLFTDEDTAFLRKAMKQKHDAKKKGKVILKSVVRAVYQENIERLGKYPFNSVYDKVRHSDMY